MLLKNSLNLIVWLCNARLIQFITIMFFVISLRWKQTLTRSLLRTQRRCFLLWLVWAARSGAVPARHHHSCTAARGLHQATFLPTRFLQPILTSWNQTQTHEPGTRLKQYITFWKATALTKRREVSTHSNTQVQPSWRSVDYWAFLSSPLLHKAGIMQTSLASLGPERPAWLLPVRRRYSRRRLNVQWTNSPTQQPLFPIRTNAYRMWSILWRHKKLIVRFRILDLSFNMEIWLWRDIT